MAILYYFLKKQMREKDSDAKNPCPHYTATSFQDIKFIKLEIKEVSNTIKTVTHNKLKKEESFS